MLPIVAYTRQKTSTKLLSLRRRGHGLAKDLSCTGNLVFPNHIHAKGVATPGLNFCGPNNTLRSVTAVGRRRRRRLPTRAHIGLALELVAGTDTVVGATTGFVGDGVVQQDFQFFSRCPVGIREQVAFAQFLFDRGETGASFAAATTTLFVVVAAVISRRRQVHDEFTTGAARVAGSGALIANRFEFVAYVVDLYLVKGVIVEFLRRKGAGARASPMGVSATCLWRGGRGCCGWNIGIAAVRQEYMHAFLLGEHSKERVLAPVPAVVKLSSL